MAATFATATAAKAAGAVTANVNGTIVTMRVARDQAVAINDVLIVERIGAQWWVLARAGETAPTPPTNPSAPDPTPPVVTGTLVVPPVETRSWRGSWRSDNSDVYQGEYAGYGNHTGCAFYGDMPRSLAGATVLSATMAVQRIPGGANAAQPTTLWEILDRFRPGGAPTRSTSVAGPNIAVGVTDNAWPLPTAWIQAMVDGGIGGLAFYEADSNPYAKFAGRDTWSPAFAITINWQRG